MVRMLILLSIVMFWLCGCYLTMMDSTLPGPSDQTTPQPDTAPESPELSDAREIFSGVCFSAARDAAERIFILRNDEELAFFFDLVDNSQLCRRPVSRGEFDFSDGRILAGSWSVGRGCEASHDVLTINRDDAARTITMRLAFHVRGGCDYELVRPFWFAIEDAGDYEITISTITPDVTAPDESGATPGS